MCIDFGRCNFFFFDVIYIAIKFALAGVKCPSILCPAGNIVVHFMLPEAREVYELEKLWTLRSYDEQLSRIPDEKLPKDFIFDLEATK